jgi:hypothetical protein
MCLLFCDPTGTETYGPHDLDNLVQKSSNSDSAKDMLKDAKTIWTDMEACSYCSLIGCDIVEFVTSVSERNISYSFGHFFFIIQSIFSQNRR